MRLLVRYGIDARLLPLPTVLVMSALLGGLGALPTFGQETPTPPVEQLEKRVQSIFDGSCARAGCHSGPRPQQGMNLSPSEFYASTVGQPSREKPALLRVDPGTPDSSYLVHKIEGRPSIEGVQMPFAGNSLSEEEISTIRSWITRLEEEGERPAPPERGPAYPFSGWRLLNLPTTRGLDQGSSLFLISHRFQPPINRGYDALYGLDGPSVIKLTLGHAFTDDLLVTLGRSNEANTVELGTHYQLAQQWGERGWPLGISAHGTLNWLSGSPPEGQSRVRSDAFKGTGQVSFARALGDRMGVLVVPGVLLNPGNGDEEGGALFTLGLGGRVTVHRNVSIFGEWVPILSGYVRTRTFGNLNRFDSWGGGVQITTSGHVFQIVFSNSAGVTTNQSLRGGDLDVRNVLDGEFRLGFNIFRVLNF